LSWHNVYLNRRVDKRRDVEEGPEPRLPFEFCERGKRAQLILRP